MSENGRAERRKRRTSLLGLVFGPKIRAFARAGLYLSAVFLALAVFAARSALGGVSEQALVVGRQLAKLEDLTQASNRLSLNGQRINLASAVSEQPIEAVLDRFEALCREQGVVVHELERLDRFLSEQQKPKSKSLLELGILREQNEHEGMVACMVDSASTTKSALEALKRFVQTEDLADVGLLRYAYARKTDSGRTHVISAWTDGSFRLAALIPPSDGTDTPGSDPEGAMRPPESVRLLTASVDGAPHAVRIYASRAAPNEVLSSYERELPKLGWQPIEAVQHDVPEARHFSRGGVDLLVVADDDGDRTAVSMVESRSR